MSRSRVSSRPCGKGATISGWPSRRSARACPSWRRPPVSGGNCRPVRKSAISSDSRRSEKAGTRPH